MKFLILFFIFSFALPSYAYKIRYNTDGEIKTIKLRLAEVKNKKIEIFGADDSIAVRKMKRITKEQITGLTNKESSLGALICKNVLKSDVALGINEFNSSASFCLFKDQSLIPLDSLATWARLVFLK